ncbi:MAG: RNA polymerase factor sigma-54 [Clostridiales bacterium]|nr:RNA polymerase factor sigma-54 [Clostridiales bacterium]
MSLQPRLEQSQKLLLTQAMRQYLHCLELPVPELQSYLEELALSNPFLDVAENALTGEAAVTAEESSPFTLSERDIWQARKESSADAPDLAAFVSRPRSFSDYLEEQLGQSASLDEQMLCLCRYLVGCLNTAGYLDCPLDQLAQELQIPLFDLEQALYVVQSLDPPGVGARSLSECLLLQLAQGRAFTEVNIHLVRSGLPLLARNDYAGLAHLLGVSMAVAKRASDCIRSLNPIPSRGFYSGEEVNYAVPEAFITQRGGQLHLELSVSQKPLVNLNADYCALLNNDAYPDAQAYLRQQMSAAKEILSGVERRQDTLFAILTAILELQHDHFLQQSPLLPMTMAQVAEKTGLHISTVSRAVKGKYIQVDQCTVALRSLFTASLNSGGQVVSADAARQQIKRFVAAEETPLSDSALMQALSGMGITLSRRTVAKYRSELGIPPASQRKRHM